MLTAEVAGTNAYANVMVKGHAKQRQRDWKKLGHSPAPSDKPNVSGWQKLAATFEQMGAPVVHGGERLVQ